MRNIVFHADAFADFTGWATADAGVFDKIRRLIVETTREPFIGIGKPDPFPMNSKGAGRAASLENTASSIASPPTRSSLWRANTIIER